MVSWLVDILNFSFIIQIENTGRIVISKTVEPEFYDLP